MKKNILLSIFLLVLFAACEKQERIYKCDAGYIKYEATIGYNFDSALDSLLTVIAYRPDEPYIIVAEPFDVVYPTNDREFFLIAFKDTADWLYLSSPNNVLDTKGDWYKVIWAKD